MGFFDDLSSVLGESDSLSNKQRAKLIAKNKDKNEIKELVSRLNYQNKGIQSDSIKVLYEVGYLKPELLIPYTENFLELLNSKNNRMVWGAMIALSTISNLDPAKLFPHLPQILNAVDQGSVITRDATVAILINLGKIPKHHEDCYHLFMEQLTSCPINQFPKYAENGLVIINDPFKKEYIQVLQKRYSECDKESMRKRIEKVLSKLNN